MKFFHRMFLFAQDFYIKINSFISPAVLHNTEKHEILKKFLFYKEIEGILGDYIEFGVYEGTSLKGAASYWRKIGSKKMRFYGFDSFTGMAPKKTDYHPFYTHFDFSTDFKQVKKRFSNFPEVSLIPGFFRQTLKKTPKHYNINKAAIVMMDCDLYSSSKLAFDFLGPVIQKGTIFILDDFFNYKGDEKKGVQAAFKKFVKNNRLNLREIIRYGIGGIVYIIIDIKK